MIHPALRFKEEVSIYDEEELSELHAVCSPYHRTLYDFFLMSGFREQEAMHVPWSNVRFNANIIEMRWKPQFNWTPKAYKEREVPVPDELLEILEGPPQVLTSGTIIGSGVGLQHSKRQA